MILWDEMCVIDFILSQLNQPCLTFAKLVINNLPTIPLYLLCHISQYLQPKLVQCLSLNGLLKYIKQNSKIHMKLNKTQQYICTHYNMKLNNKVHTKQHETQTTHKQTQHTNLCLLVSVQYFWNNPCRHKNQSPFIVCMDSIDAQFQSS